MNMKRTVIGVVMLLLLTTLGVRAERLLTDEEALKEMLPGVDRIEKVTKNLTDEQVDHIKHQIKVMVLHQEGSEAKTLEEKRDYTFYIGIKDNKKVGVVVFETQPGKWGPVTFVLSLEPATAKITNMAVTTYVEKRGRPIAQRSFLSQFFGKSSKDSLEVGQDYRAISGATISSRCTAFVVRKMSTLYDEVFLHAPLADRLTDMDSDIRAGALTEMTKLDGEKDKVLQQLLDKLGSKETPDGEKQIAVGVLNGFSQPEARAKLSNAKLSAPLVLSENLASALEKLAAAMQLKLSWVNEDLHAAAGQVKIKEIKATDKDIAFNLLENLLYTYGVKGTPDDKNPTLAYWITADTLTINDLTAAQKQCQDWWEATHKPAK